MKDLLEVARQDLLEPAGLSDTQLQQVLYNLAGRNIDYADLYFQSSYSETWGMEEGILKSGSFDIDRGVGVRAVSGEKTGFAYSDDIELNSLEEAARAAKSIAQTGNANSLAHKDRKSVV